LEEVGKGAVMARASSFHNTYDELVRANKTYTTGGGWTTKDVHITLRDRSVTYEFFPHFHPYVPDLIRRLNEGGISGLQDSDTLYLPQPANGHPLSVLGDSTRAVLTHPTSATRDGRNVSLFPGTPLTLRDSTSVTITAGTTVFNLDGSTYSLPSDQPLTLPGALPLAFSSGLQCTIQNNKDIVVPDSTEVLLQNGAQRTILTVDGSEVDLPANTKVAIRHGLPKPYFYEDSFAARYNPDSNNTVHPYPVKDLDFSVDGAYSLYNWELFFHAPLLIAIHLSQNQKFQEAQRWFHYIFNPTDNSHGPTPERFWKVKPFESTDVRMIGEILLNLSTKQDPKLADQTAQSINAWKQNPFQPFAVAKYRPTAYMLKTVMAYLDNLIKWGDSLFRQYTIETINEATQLYVMAANILGPKPQLVSRQASAKPLTFNLLRDKALDEFSNTLAEIEVDIPFDISPLPNPPSNPAGTQILAGIGQALYFCVPRNDKLLGYWTTVADRLFKIHNSLNLQGVFQRLPLFDPPIDPALLVRAAASGLDVNAIVSGLNQPLPLVRFQFLVSKAAEICQELKSLGANLLAIMEKGDIESLALLRAQHESAILGLAESVKYSQWQEAIKATQGLQQSFANVGQRYVYYQKLLGNNGQINIPQLDAVDVSGLQNLNFSQSDNSSEPQLTFDTINIDIAQDSTSVSDGEIKTLSKHEVEELNKLAAGRDAQVSASNWDAIGSYLSLIPQFDGNIEPMGCGASVGFGGVQLHAMCTCFASLSRGTAEDLAYQSNKTSKLGSYSRREDEWLFQSNSAKGEINQILKQLRAAQIREAIAEKEYKNHKKQIEQAGQIVDFLEGNEVPGFQPKETTTGFYAWMKREIKALHGQAFQLAFEVAKKAERAMRNELGDPTLSYFQYNYLDGTEGLLAGEKLMLDIKAMELAYHDLNQREYELTKHISLQQLDPLALLQLRATGSCTFTLPEELFDLDVPLYFRRIDSVAVTVPCVTGPYASVNCTLTLLNSSIRTSTDVSSGYERTSPDDPRFSDYYGTVQSIVTSSGQSDSGIFENPRDERSRPFEKLGIARSRWNVTLHSDVPQFDPDTMTDVILDVRYTGREPGQEFKDAAIGNLKNKIQQAQTVGSVRLFSVRHEFPSEWAKFRNVSIGNGSGTGPQTAPLSLSLSAQHYPFWAQQIFRDAQRQNKRVGLKAVGIFAEMPPNDATTQVNLYDHADPAAAAVKSESLNQNPSFGSFLAGNLTKIPLPNALADPPASPPLTLYFDNNSMKNLWVAITWPKS